MQHLRPKHKAKRLRCRRKNSTNPQGTNHKHPQRHQRRGTYNEGTCCNTALVRLRERHLKTRPRPFAREPETILQPAAPPELIRSRISRQALTSNPCHIQSKRRLAQPRPTRNTRTGGPCAAGGTGRLWHQSRATSECRPHPPRERHSRRTCHAAHARMPASSMLQRRKDDTAGGPNRSPRKPLWQPPQHCARPNSDCARKMVPIGSCAPALCGMNTQGGLWAQVGARP